MPTFVPARRRGVEVLDSPDVTTALRTRSHRDIALSNALFGGTRALLVELEGLVPALRAAGRAATFIDIGTGTGEATASVARFLRARGVEVRTIALDADAALARAASRHAHDAVCASALALPLADESVDVVACSQVAHHFPQDELPLLVREMDRVARQRVIISDLRRSWLAVAGLWSSSFPLLFHPVSRHDGVVSILRGFTADELRMLVHRAVGAHAIVRRRWAFRLTATWSPSRVTAPPSRSDR